MSSQQKSKRRLIEQFARYALSYSDKKLFEKLSDEEIDIGVHSNWEEYDMMNILTYMYKRRTTTTTIPCISLLKEVKFLVDYYYVDINNSDGCNMTLFKYILLEKEQKLHDDFYKYVIENSDLPTQEYIVSFIKKHNTGSTLSIWHQGLLSHINATRDAKDAKDTTVANNTNPDKIAFSYCISISNFLRKRMFYFTPEMIHKIIRNNIMNVDTSYEIKQRDSVYIRCERCSNTDHIFDNDTIYTDSYIYLLMCYSSKHICIVDRRPYKQTDIVNRCREIFLNIIKTINRGHATDTDIDTIKETIYTLVNAFRETNALFTP